MKFADLGLSPEVLKAVTEQGYDTPTPIQAEAIPHVLQGKDVLGIAQTGTGKTAGFTLPMIDRLARGRAKARMPRSLILCPTRELATQVSENFEVYGKYHKLTMALLIGGVAFSEQEKKIDRGVDVLIATPGRLLDHVERGKLVLLGVQILVVDEADRMLDMGFIPDVERICSLVPPRGRQGLFFSATMAPEITRLTEKFLSDPVRVEVARQSTTADTVTQKLVEVGPRQKHKALRHLLDEEEIDNAIVFCNRKRDVSELSSRLHKNGYSVAALHGDIPQSVRTDTLERYKKGEIKILIASDVAARGLDIPAVSHVFNYDVPINAEDYVHRIGRTGRAGREGATFMLATRSDEKYLKAIEALIQKEIPRVELGDGFAAPKKAEDSDKADGKADDKAEAKAEDKAEAKSEPAAQAKADDKPSRNASRNAKSRDNRDNKGRDNRNRGRGNRRSGDDAQVLDSNRGVDVIVGLGDHVPAFLLRPARPQKPADTSANQDG